MAYYYDCIHSYCIRRNIIIYEEIKSYAKKYNRIQKNKDLYGALGEHLFTHKESYFSPRTHGVLQVFMCLVWIDIEIGLLIL